MIKHTSGAAPGFVAHSPNNQRQGFGGNRNLETSADPTTAPKEQASFEVTLSKEAQDTLAADTQASGDAPDATETPAPLQGPGRSGQSPAHLARQYWTPDSGVPFGQYVSQIAKDRDWVPPELRAEDPAVEEPSPDNPDAVAGTGDETTGDDPVGDDLSAGIGDETPVVGDPAPDDGTTAAAILEAALEDGQNVDSNPSLVEELLEEDTDTTSA